MGSQFIITMNKIENIRGCILAEEFSCSEDFHVKGLLLPKDKVSRNGVLYDWESAKQKAKLFIGKTVNYNHIIDDDKPPVGKVEDIIVKEEDDEDGMAGLYYDLSIDEDGEYAKSIKKGYLNKVSLQVTADAQKEETNDDGDTYTRAWIKDPLEISVVKVPGFDETTMEVAIAEAFNAEGMRPRKGIRAKKKHLLKAGAEEDEDNHSEEAGISTGNIPSKTKMADNEEEACSDSSKQSKKEFKVVDALVVLTDDEAAELLESFNENQMGPYTVETAKKISIDMDSNDYRLIYSDKVKKWFFINKDDVDFHFWGVKIDIFQNFQSDDDAINYLTDGKKIEKLGKKETEELLNIVK